MESLVISGERLEPAELARRAAAAGERLRSLTLFDLALDEHGLAAVLERIDTGELAELYLGWNHLGPGAARVLARASTRLPKLETLHLYHNDLGDEGLAELSAAGGFASLARLNVCGNNFGAGGARALARSALFARLETFAAGCNHLADEGMIALAPAASACGLLDVNVKWNAIGPRGVRAMCDSPAFARLEKLSLEDDPIGDEGVDSLARSPCASHLRSLHLGAIGIDEHGARSLAELEQVEELNVWANPIGERGVESLLEGTTRLRILDARETGIGEAAASRLLGHPRARRLEQLRLE